MGEQPCDAVEVFTAALRGGATQVVHTRARVRIEVQKRRVFFAQMLDHAAEHDVLEHVGEISRVKGVGVVHREFLD